LAGVFTKITEFDISGTTVSNPPSISVSQNADIVVVYGTEASIFTVKGRRVHFAQSKAVTLTFPELFNTQSYITVSSRFIYARNTVDKVGTTLKYHGGYFINGKVLSKYFEETLTALTNWKRSLIEPSSEEPLRLFHEIDAVGVVSVTISDRTLPIEL
jgi:hypothetical protein